MTLVFAVMHLYNILEFFIASVHSFFNFILFLKSGIDKSTEWSMIPLLACPSLMCFFNRGDSEGTHFFENFVSDVCVCFVYVNLCHD